MSLHRCDSCGKRRANVTVVVEAGVARDLCPACLPPLRPAVERKFNPAHHDPLIRHEGEA